MLHIDLFRPIGITSLKEKKYELVIVDDYSRFTWMLFFAHESYTFSTFIKYFKKVTNEKGTTIVTIRSDHGNEFDNSLFERFL